MKLKRNMINDFNIPKEYMNELLSHLENGLKEVETNVDEKVVYGVINNIIKDKYENNESYKNRSVSFLHALTRTVIEGKGDKEKISLWYDLSNRASYPNPDDPQNKDYITKDEMLEIEYGFKFDEIND